MAELERSFAFDKYWDFLPILPQNLLKHPRRESPASGAGKTRGAKGGKGKSEGAVLRQYKTAQALLKGAKRIVNAGDIDREGQLIVDELLEHFGIDPYGPKVMRFGIASNLPGDIAAAVLAGLDRNSDERWRRACEAAATREYLDWAWGINMSMAGQALHKNARISAGRVQTPVLALVDKRCREIENFKPQDYYVPIVVLKDGTTLRWKARPGSEGKEGFDSQGRIISEGLARAIVDRISKGLPGEITKAEVTQHAQKPPLGYSLSSLQATASKTMGITLEQAQMLPKTFTRTTKPSAI